MINGFTVEMLKELHSENYGGLCTHVYAVGSFNRTAMEEGIRQ